MPAVSMEEQSPSVAKAISPTRSDYVRAEARTLQRPEFFDKGHGSSRAVNATRYRWKELPQWLKCLRENRRFIPEGRLRVNPVQINFLDAPELYRTH